MCVFIYLRIPARVFIINRSRKDTARIVTICYVVLNRTDKQQPFYVCGCSRARVNSLSRKKCARAQSPFAMQFLPGIRATPSIG